MCRLNTHSKAGGGTVVVTIGLDSPAACYVKILGDLVFGKKILETFKLIGYDRPDLPWDNQGDDLAARSQSS